MSVLKVDSLEYLSWTGKGSAVIKESLEGNETNERSESFQVDTSFFAAEVFCQNERIVAH